MRNLQINGERLWASLMELAEIGATPKGGVCRLAASDLDGEARRLFIPWCEEAGCTVRVDNEEGSRFSPAMVGSGVFAGVFDLAEGLARPRTI
jgi:acetylornithine deacetylase/succinyl-diaminopimelate desuccinylase-like protein